MRAIDLLTMIPLFLLTLPVVAAAAPDDFPRFRVPGHEKAMDSVRELYWLHYPGSGPKATLWDAWLAPPSLWPDTGDESQKFRREWAAALTARHMDPDGYVATHQHGSIAHPTGWPFPFWNQGAGGYGWHFSFKDTVGPPWRKETTDKPEGWTLEGATDAGLDEDGWNLRLTGERATITTPMQEIDPLQAPFVQVRWRGKGLENARVRLEWKPRIIPEFYTEGRIELDAPRPGAVSHAAIPLYRHPYWNGAVNRLRLVVENADPDAEITLQALFTQYDTRHNINSQSFLDGCHDYFNWTGDYAFLRANINRMRSALRTVMTEHEALDRKMVVTTSWVGHDGRAGFTVNPDGSKTMHTGHGVGNNYWDLLPFGGKDAYATLRYYAALREMAEIERAVRAHPEWNIPTGPLAFDPDFLLRHAAEVKEVGNKTFWNAKTGRFVACIDADGKGHDYGYTFVNLEAIYYGFATDEHAKAIMDWVSGKRTVEGDTATGADIYRFRFGPRATTRRNVDWYGWFWSGPETIPWGGQVQDGGAVLGFSYHDLMSRLYVNGPDDAWARLKEIVAWFDEVRAAGGYRAYYKDMPGVTLQGGGTAGGLGLDHEFFESVLVPQVMLDGFLGFAPTPDGFRLDPKLPRDWPSLTIDRIKWRGLTLEITATSDTVTVFTTSGPDQPAWVHMPPGWIPDGYTAPRRADGAYRVVPGAAVEYRFTRNGE